MCDWSLVVVRVGSLEWCYIFTGEEVELLEVLEYVAWGFFFGGGEVLVLEVGWD